MTAKTFRRKFLAVLVAMGYSSMAHPHTQESRQMDRQACRTAERQANRREYERKLKLLQDAIDAQLTDGNWNCSEYDHGVANGLIEAKAIITDTRADYLTTPSGGYIK